MSLSLRLPPITNDPVQALSLDHAGENPRAFIIDRLITERPHKHRLTADAVAIKPSGKARLIPVRRGHDLGDGERLGITETLDDCAQLLVGERSLDDIVRRVEFRKAAKASNSALVIIGSASSASQSLVLGVNHGRSLSSL